MIIDNWYRDLMDFLNFLHGLVDTNPSQFQINLDHEDLRKKFEISQTTIALMRINSPSEVKKIMTSLPNDPAEMQKFIKQCYLFLYRDAAQPQYWRRGILKYDHQRYITVNSDPVTAQDLQAELYYDNEQVKKVLWSLVYKGEPATYVLLVFMRSSFSKWVTFHSGWQKKLSQYEAPDSLVNESLSFDFTLAPNNTGADMSAFFPSNLIYLNPWSSSLGDLMYFQIMNSWVNLSDMVASQGSENQSCWNFCNNSCFCQQSTQTCKKLRIVIPAQGDQPARVIENRHPLSAWMSDMYFAKLSEYYAMRLKQYRPAWDPEYGPGKPGTNQYCTLYINRMLKLRNQILELNCGKSRGLMAHQLIVSLLLHPSTPFNRMAFFHQTGAGKTLTILAILTAFFYEPIPKVLFFPTQAVRNNFYHELMKFDNPYRTYVMRHVDPSGSMKDMFENDSERSQWMSQHLNKVIEILDMKGVRVNDIRNGTVPGAMKAPIRAFTMSGGGGSMLDTHSIYNFIEREPGVQRNPFDGAVVLVDEAHNLCFPSTNMLKNHRAAGNIERIRQFLYKSTSAKFFAFTATPIVNRVEDADTILDLVKGEAYVQAMKVQRAKLPPNQREIPGEHEGFVSFFNGTPTSVFPRTIPANISTHLPHIENVPMGPKHLANYERKVKDYSDQLWAEVEAEVTKEMANAPQNTTMTTSMNMGVVTQTNPSVPDSSGVFAAGKTRGSRGVDNNRGRGRGRGRHKATVFNAVGGALGAINGLSQQAVNNYNKAIVDTGKHGVSTLNQNMAFKSWGSQASQWLQQWSSSLTNPANIPPSTHTNVHAHAHANQTAGMAVNNAATHVTNLEQIKNVKILSGVVNKMVNLTKNTSTNGEDVVKMKKNLGNLNYSCAAGVYNSQSLKKLKADLANPKGKNFNTADFSPASYSSKYNKALDDYMSLSFNQKYKKTLIMLDGGSGCITSFREIFHDKIKPQGGTEFMRKKAPGETLIPNEDYIPYRTFAIITSDKNTLTDLPAKPSRRKPRHAGLDGEEGESDDDDEPKMSDEAAYILSIYNSAENADGAIISCIVMDIKERSEGISILATQNLFLLNIPSTAAAYLQVLGRAIRMCGHMSLDQFYREVKLRMYVSVFPVAGGQTLDQILLQQLINEREKVNVKMEWLRSISFDKDLLADVMKIKDTESSNYLVKFNNVLASIQPKANATIINPISKPTNISNSNSITNSISQPNHNPNPISNLSSGILSTFSNLFTRSNNTISVPPPPPPPPTTTTTTTKSQKVKAVTTPPITNKTLLAYPPGIREKRLTYPPGMNIHQSPPPPGITMKNSPLVPTTGNTKKSLPVVNENTVIDENTTTPSLWEILDKKPMGTRSGFLKMLKTLPTVVNFLIKFNSNPTPESVKINIKQIMVNIVDQTDNQPVLETLKDITSAGEPQPPWKIMKPTANGRGKMWVVDHKTMRQILKTVMKSDYLSIEIKVVLQNSVAQGTRADWNTWKKKSGAGFMNFLSQPAVSNSSSDPEPDSILDKLQKREYSFQFPNSQFNSEWFQINNDMTLVATWPQTNQVSP